MKLLPNVDHPCLLGLQVVAPKQDSLQKAEAELRQQMDRLMTKQSELKEVTDKLNFLQANLNSKQQEKVVMYCHACM